MVKKFSYSLKILQTTMLLRCWLNTVPHIWSSMMIYRGQLLWFLQGLFHPLSYLRCIMRSIFLFLGAGEPGQLFQADDQSLGLPQTDGDYPGGFSSPSSSISLISSAKSLFLYVFCNNLLATLLFS